MNYSSDQFYRDWRYAVDKSFVDANGKPFEYAENGEQCWGDEVKCLQFESPPNTAAISHGGRHLAVAVDQDIHVWDTTSNDLVLLRGHTSRVDTLAFQPGEANVLVSCAMNNMGGSVPTEPIIIFWDLSAHKGPGQLSGDDVANVSKHAVRAVVERLTDLDSSLHLVLAEQEFLATSFTPSISQALAKNNVSGNVKINGRLPGNFQSNVFSPSGRYMMYLPGQRPPSNGDEAWDINIYDMEKKRDVLTLIGHRDAIMWLGYSPDETLVGTVCWDKTMRIWDAGTGEVKYTFETQGQNWTGGFSPDGTMFAGTCGNGSIHVYSLHDGTEIFWSDFGRWCRTLDWSPDSAYLTVGGQGSGKLDLIDVKKQEVVQERTLSTKRAKVKNEGMRRFLGSHLEVYRAKFVDGGRKIVHFTSGDGSAEVFDLVKCCKWRFARAGTDSYSEAVEDVEDMEKEDEVVSKGGFDMVVWEDSVKGLVMLATVDGDAVRLWSVPLTDLHAEPNE